jgi:hypothetical protein
MDDNAALQSLSNRVGHLEEGMRTMSMSLATHLGSYDATQKAAEESRSVIRKTLGDMDTKIERIGSGISFKVDKLIEAHDQQVGAIKFGKWLYGLIGAIGAAAAWIASHITFMR